MIEKLPPNSWHNLKCTYFVAELTLLLTDVGNHLVDFLRDILQEPMCILHTAGTYGMPLSESEKKKKQ